MLYRLGHVRWDLTHWFGAAVSLYILLVFGAVEARSQACAIKQVPAAGQAVPTTNENFSTLANCIADLSARLAASTAVLERTTLALSEMRDDAAAFGRGQGAVVAFHRSENEGACPRGWGRLPEASGRFIVGAGVNTWADINNRPLTNHPSLKDKPAGAVGGEEVHVLA